MIYVSLKIPKTGNRHVKSKMGIDAAVVSLVIKSNKISAQKKGKDQKKVSDKYKQINSPGWFRSHTRFFLLFLDLIMLAKTCELFVLK
jgi:hypothetical protein